MPHASPGAPDATTPEAAPLVAFERARRGDAGFEAVRSLADTCRACDLWSRATQTVFGSGPVPARWMLVGEQPGDQEDRAGAPFVGPAGRVLADALGEAGIDRERAFVTNVVKHFKWKPSPGSKRRLHESPNRAEVGACLPWVETELALVRPASLVLLGSTAAQGLLGPGVRVMRDRGVWRGAGASVGSPARPGRVPLPPDLIPPLVVVTIHPSAVLRSASREDRDALFDGLVHDLRLAAAVPDPG